MLFKICSYILLSTCACTSYSQPIIPRFETLGVNEGLSQSSVYTILQDRQGFMWFGTADGLNRFDGTEIKIYKSKDVLASQGNSNYIRGKLCEDAKGNIWYANETAIYYYSRSEEVIKIAKTFDARQFSNLNFSLLGIDKEQRLWMMNTLLGISVYTIRTGEFAILPLPPDFNNKYGYTVASVMDAQANTWLTMYEKNSGVYKFDGITKTFQQYFKNIDVRRICFGKGKAYLLAPDQIFIYDSLSKKVDSLQCFIGSKPIFNFNTVFEDAFGRLWILTANDGLIYYDIKQKKFHAFTHDNSKPKSLSIDLLTTVFVDRNNNLWVGTDGGGVCRLNLMPPRFNLFPLNEGDYPFLKDYFIKCFYEDEQKRIWFGTHSNGFNIFDPANGTVINYSNKPGDVNSLPGNIVGAIFKDKEDNTWIGHSMGFSIFNEKQKKFTTIPISTSSPLHPWAKYVNSLIQLSNGNLLASTEYGLVIIKKTERGFKAKTFTYGPPASQSSAAAELTPGNIWFTCPTYGLFGLTHAKLVKDSFIIQQRFFHGLDLRCIHQDEQEPQIIWVASPKGLIKFNTLTKDFLKYDEINGMANSYVYGILEDKKHNLWVSTNGGLIYFNKKEQSFQNYSVNDGLQSNEFNTSAFYKGASGTFYFGGVKGFNWFNAIKSTTNSSKPGAAITSILINDIAFQKDSLFLANKIISLSYDQNNLAFNFAALDFTRPQANKIQYRLEQWDPQWITASPKTVRYANLPHGNYVLKVRASGPDEIWSEEESITITIKAPFWKSRWFYSIIISVVLLSIVIITRSIAQKNLRKQLQQLEKQRAIEWERDRISKDMHDEIGSGLTHIALMSELMQTQKKGDGEIRKEVGNISSSARKLVASMSEIIWALNPQNDTLENLLAYIREQTVSYFEPFPLYYSIQFPDKIPAIKLSNEQRRNLFLVAKEALNNALKHSGAGRISLSMEYINDRLEFSISDDGKGFDKTRTKVASNGLRNMQRRMEDIGGSFIMQTNNTGTCIHFSLRVPDKYKNNGTTFFTSLKKR